MTLSEIEIPGFELDRTLGAGGFGAVWLADQPSVGRKVAVKIGHQPLADDMARLRFERECQALGRLSGRSDIVAVHVAGTLDDGRPYIVMEYIDGGTLWERVQQAPLSAVEVATVGTQLCAALDHAHRADILHRDVKPENVFVRTDGSIVLGDFGIAAVLDTAATRSGVLAATIPYSPPEVLNGARASVASDVYSVGATLLASATRSVPFMVDTDESLPSLLGRVLQGNAPDIRDFGYPDPLAALVRQMMAPDPAARPATAAMAAGRLRAVAEQLDLGAGTVIAPVPNPSPGTVVAPGSGHAVTPPPATPVSYTPAPGAPAPGPYTPAPTPNHPTPAPHTPAPAASPAGYRQPGGPQPGPQPGARQPGQHQPGSQQPGPQQPAPQQPGAPLQAGWANPTSAAAPLQASPAPTWDPGQANPTGGTTSSGGSRAGLLVGGALVALVLIGLVAVAAALAGNGDTGGDTATPDIDTAVGDGTADGSTGGDPAGGDPADSDLTNGGAGTDDGTSSDIPVTDGESANDRSRDDADAEVVQAPDLAPIDTPLTVTDLGFPADIEPLQIVLGDDELGFCGVPIDTSAVVERKEVLTNHFVANDQVGQTAFRFEDEDGAVDFVDEIVDSLVCDSADDVTLDGTGQQFTTTTVEIVPQQSFGDDTVAWASTIVFANGFVVTQESYLVRRFDRVISVGYASDEPAKVATTASLMELMVERLGYDT